ncbi:Rossmann-like and DUF2520 domain-containing protein [Peijinzhouia sedimentorum]
MSKYYKVTIIGSGNVAWHLSRALEDAGHFVLEVYSRNIKDAISLTKRLYDAEAVDSLDFSNSESEVFILAVSDSAIEEIVGEIILPDNAIIAHTSGAMSISELGYAPTEHLGVFYPLQTFSKGKIVDWKQIPILIEAETQACADALETLGESISSRVLSINSAKRQEIHLSAVFASNFTTYILSLSEQILAERKLDFDLLKPLIAETINKCFDMSPYDALTGPARRGDMETLNRHIQMLEGNQSQKEVYKILSQQILDAYFEG